MNLGRKETRVRRGLHLPWPPGGREGRDGVHPPGAEGHVPEPRGLRGPAGRGQLPTGGQTSTTGPGVQTLALGLGTTCSATGWAASTFSTFLSFTFLALAAKAFRSCRFNWPSR